MEQVTPELKTKLQLCSDGISIVITPREYRSLVWYYWRETLCAFGSGVLLAVYLHAWWLL